MFSLSLSLSLFMLRKYILYTREHYSICILCYVCTMLVSIAYFVVNNIDRVFYNWFDERSLQLLFQIVGDNDELERMIFNMIWLYCWKPIIMCVIKMNSLCSTKTYMDVPNFKCFYSNLNKFVLYRKGKVK